MKSKALLLVLVTLGPIHLVASDTPAAPNVLEVATKQAGIWDDPDHPFVMDLEFQVHSSPPIQGHLRLRHKAKDLWWSKISYDKFEQVKFQKGEWTYTLRNADYTPRRILDVLRLLRVGATYSKLLTWADRQRTENGIRLDCLEGQDPKFKSEHIQMCVDPTTHDIVSETQRLSGYEKDFVRRFQFSDFIEFRGHRYPRTLEYLKDGSLIISANVTDLEEAPIDPKLFDPPHGAIERRECADMKSAEELSHPIPQLDPGRHDWLALDAEVTVLTDGTVGNVAIIGRPGGVYGGLMVEMLKKWKFKPAMCGTEPVVSDVYESFDLGNTVAR